MAKQPENLVQRLFNEFQKEFQEALTEHRRHFHQPSQQDLIAALSIAVIIISVGLLVAGLMLMGRP